MCIAPDNDENVVSQVVKNCEQHGHSAGEAREQTRFEEDIGDLITPQEQRLSPSPTEHSDNSGPPVAEGTIRTPKTPRHRDALSKRAPVTPRHHFAPANPLTPRTPRTPVISRSIYNDVRKVFTRGSNSGPLVGREKERQEARQFIEHLVNSSQGGCLYVSGPPGTGKSALVSEICQAVKDITKVKQSFVNCMSLQNASDIFNVLASELGSTDDVFGNQAKEALHAMFTSKDTKETFLVVLDEVDQLLNLDINVMYTLFEWSLQNDSNLVLLGIANALDLTDRFLPRLKARNLKPQLLPFLPYTALEIATILKARTRSLLPIDAMTAAEYTPFLHPAAIQLIAKKVATQNGDLRRAFDITKRALSLVEAETQEKFQQLSLEPGSPSGASKRSPLTENNNLSSPVCAKSATPSQSHGSSTWAQDFSRLTAVTAPRVMLSHVAQVTTAAFNNGTSSRVKALNLQQKAVLCALVALEQSNRRVAFVSTPPTTPSKKRKTKFCTHQTTPSQTPVATTIRALFDAYAVLCSRDNVMHPLSNTEFRDVVGTLESLSLVSAPDGKTGSMGIVAPMTPSKRRKGGFGHSAIIADQREISSCIGLQELEAAIEGVGSGILKAILSGDGF